jgi:hypothetical protein
MKNEWAQCLRNFFGWQMGGGDDELNWAIRDDMMDE